MTEIERWFIGRGVPHFIDDYAPTTDIWNRSLPVLFVAYFAGGLHALDLQGWSVRENLFGAATVIVVLVVGAMVINRLRNRPMMRMPDVVGTPELMLFVIGPTLPSLFFEQWGDAVQTVIEGAAVLLVVYVGTSYAVVPLMGWAIRRSVAQLSTLASLVARALPLLLLFTTFLFINAEVWQVAGTLEGVPYVATLGIFFTLGALFVLSRIPGIMRGLATFSSWHQIVEAVEGTPAAQFDLPQSGQAPDFPLGPRQRVNAALVAVFSQAVQITLVALVLTLFFSLFGFLAITEATTIAWTGLDEVNVLTSVEVSGRQLIVSEPLLRVSGFLGAFTGMYFTVVLSTDATYRDEFADDVGPRIRQALAVRLAYLWHRLRTSAP